MARNCSEVRDLIDAATARGWTVSRTNAGHLRFTHRTGAVVFGAKTPSDWRAIKNLDANLRRVERQTEAPT